MRDNACYAKFSKLRAVFNAFFPIYRWRLDDSFSFYIYIYVRGRFHLVPLLGRVVISISDRFLLVVFIFCFFLQSAVSSGLQNFFFYSKVFLKGGSLDVKRRQRVIANSTHPVQRRVGFRLRVVLRSLRVRTKRKMGVLVV